MGSSSTLNVVVKNDNRDWHLMAHVDTQWHSASIRNSWKSGGYSVNYYHAVLWIRAHRGHGIERQMVSNEAIWRFFVISSVSFLPTICFQRIHISPEQLMWIIANALHSNQAPVLSLHDILDLMSKNETSFLYLQNRQILQIPLIFENKNKQMTIGFNNCFNFAEI